MDLNKDCICYSYSF